MIAVAYSRPVGEYTDGIVGAWGRLHPSKEGEKGGEGGHGGSAELQESGGKGGRGGGAIGPQAWPKIEGALLGKGGRVSWGKKSSLWGNGGSVLSASWSESGGGGGGAGEELSMILNRRAE